MKHGGEMGVVTVSGRTVEEIARPRGVEIH